MGQRWIYKRGSKDRWMNREGRMERKNEMSGNDEYDEGWVRGG